MTERRCARTLSAGLLAVVPVLAFANEAAHVRLSTGLDYSSGKFGGSMTTETWYMPIILKYEQGRTTAKLTVPYIRTSGPGDVVGVGPDRIPLPEESTVRRTAEGMGDTVVSLGYNLIDGRASGFVLDVVGKLKLPTADKDKGLGTGETDVSIQVDMAHMLGTASVFGTVRWKKYGDPHGRDFRDPLYLSIGSGYRLRPGTTIGLAYDWRQKVSDYGSEMSEMSAFVSQKLDERWKVQGYLIHGFSDASPDWGGGVLIHRMFN